MKKILFISNITNRITSFSISSIIAAQSLGYEFHIASNLSNFSDDPSKYNIIMHHIDIVRNPLSLKNIRAYKQMLKLIEKEKFDVIHCNTPIGGVIGRLCGKKAKVKKIIYTAHGFHFYKGAPFIKSTIFKCVERFLARYTDVLITINHEDYLAAQKFKLKKNGKVYYIPGVGIDIKKFNNIEFDERSKLEEIGVPLNSFIIISVGELNKNKNHQVVIKSLAKLRNPDIYYIICGSGKYEIKLLKLIKKFNLENNVKLLGYRKDIAQLLNVSDIMIHPSYREGLPLAVMEAMASGLPIIASTIRGNVDLIEDNKNGFLVKPNDINEYIRSIEYLFMDMELRKKMSEYSLNIINRYDINNIKKLIKNIYCNL